MLINFLISLVVSIFNLIFGFLPVVSISTIPLIGSYISSGLLFMVTTWNALLVTFPYASTAWNIFLFVIIPFEILLLVGKILLGSRMPGNQH